MPTEHEELKLTVTLVDNASAGLSKLKEQLKDLGGGGQGQRNVEKIGKDTADLEKQFKSFGGTLGDTFKSLASLRTSYVAAAGGLGLFAHEMLQGVEAVGKYSDSIRNMAQLGAKIGVDPGVIRNISDQLKIFGVSGEQAQASIAKFAAGMAALQRDPSVRKGILERTDQSNPAAVRNMEQILDRLNAAKTMEEKMEIARQATEDVRRNARKRGESEERAADAASKFGQELKYDMELGYAGKLKERTEDEKKADAARIENAKAYSQELAKVYQKWDDIRNVLNDEAMGPNGPFIKGLRLANDLLGFILEKLKDKAFQPDKAKGAIQERFDKFGLGKPKPELELTPEQFRTMPHAERLARGISPISFGGEDHKKGIDANTQQLKALNDLLRAAMGFGGGTGGGGGLGGGGSGIQNAAYHPGGGGPFGPRADGGAGGSGRTGGGGAILDQSGKGVDPETVGQLKQLAAQGNTSGMRQLMASRGYRVDSAWCGDLARTLAGGSGFQVPKAYPVASAWRGVGEHVEPSAINEPNRPFGSLVASKTNVPIGQTGGHVMAIVPGSYDPKTNTAEVIDTGGRRRRSLSGFELRQLPPVDAAAKVAAQDGKYPTEAELADKSRAAGERFNNPFNMWFDKYAKGEGGLPGRQITPNDTPSVFPSKMAGAAAAIRKMAESPKYSGKTMQDLIGTWVGHGQSYAPVIEKMTGISRDTKITPEFLRSEAGLKFLKAMARYETRAQVPYPLTDKQWREARDRALGDDRRQLDQAQASETKVKGTGTITVDVNAPKGTNVGAQGGGLFTKVDINRQTQMSEAPRGPKGGYATEQYLQ